MTTTLHPLSFWTKQNIHIKSSLIPRFVSTLNIHDLTALIIFITVKEPCVNLRCPSLSLVYGDTGGCWQRDICEGHMFTRRAWHSRLICSVQYTNNTRTTLSGQAPVQIPVQPSNPSLHSSGCIKMGTLFNKWFNISFEHCEAVSKSTANQVAVTADCLERLEETFGYFKFITFI